MKRVSVILPEELLATVLLNGKKNGRKLSQEIRFCLGKYQEQKGEGK